MVLTWSFADWILDEKFSFPFVFILEVVSFVLEVAEAEVCDEVRLLLFGPLGVPVYRIDIDGFLFITVWYYKFKISAPSELHLTEKHIIGSIGLLISVVGSLTVYSKGAIQKKFPYFLIDREICCISDRTTEHTDLYSSSEVNRIPKFAVHHLGKIFLPRLDVRFYCIHRIRIQLIQYACYCAW